jgi:hypothetical protein
MTIRVGVSDVAVGDAASVVADGGTGVEGVGGAPIGLADDVTVSFGIEVDVLLAVDEGDKTGVCVPSAPGDWAGGWTVEVGVLTVTIPVSVAPWVTGAKMALLAVIVTLTTIVSLSKDELNALTRVPPFRSVPPRSRRATDH